jgi:hypothetical protein
MKNGIPALNCNTYKTLAEEKFRCTRCWARATREKTERNLHLFVNSLPATSQELNAMWHISLALSFGAFRICLCQNGKNNDQDSER